MKKKSSFRARTFSNTMSSLPLQAWSQCTLPRGRKEDISFFLSHIKSKYNVSRKKWVFNNFQSPCCPATSNTMSVQLQCYTKKLLAHPDCMDVPHLNPQHKQKRSSVLQGLSFFEFHPHTAEYPTISDLTLSSSLEPCVHALANRSLKVEVGRSTRCSRGVSFPKQNKWPEWHVCQERPL